MKNKYLYLKSLAFFFFCTLQPEKQLFLSRVNLKIHLFTTDIAFILYVVFVAPSKEIKLIHNSAIVC